MQEQTGKGHMDIAKRNKENFQVERMFDSLKEKYIKTKKTITYEFKSGMAERRKREWHLQEKI